MYIKIYVYLYNYISIYIYISIYNTYSAVERDVSDGAVEGGRVLLLMDVFYC